MKLSVMTGGITLRFGMERGYELIRQAGFEAVDWNLNDLLDKDPICQGQYRGNILEQPLETLVEYFKPEMEAMGKNGITIAQAHAPFPAYLEHDPDLYPYMLEINEKCVRLCAAFGCKHLVIHGINRAVESKQIEALNWQMYTSLIPVLKETGVVVCLENLYATVARERHGTNFAVGHCSDPYKAADLIDRLNQEAGQECFGLCLDIGHMHLLRIDPRFYMPILGSRIKVLHIHDNDRHHDNHQIPFSMNVNFEDIVKALKEVGYNGYFTLEADAFLKDYNENNVFDGMVKLKNSVRKLADMFEKL